MIIKCRNYFIYIYSIRAFIRFVLQIFLLSFETDHFSESIILLELEPFSLEFGLTVFQNVLLSVMCFLFKSVK